MSHNDITGFAVLEIPLESNEMATILYNAILPETKSVPSDRATSKISIKDTTLVLEIEANDLTALRASINSFTAWISACISTFESIEKS